MSISGRIIKSGLKLHHHFASQAHQQPFALQAETIKSLVRRAEHTAFGRHYAFSRILQSSDPVRAFQEQVPIHDYDNIFNAWWHRLLEEEANVVWPGRTRYFALSSGTSGSPSKYIPVSDEMLAAMRRTSKFMLAHSTQLGLPSSFYGRQFLMLSSSTDLTQKGDVKIGDVSGINSSRVPYWFRAFYRPGKFITRMRDWDSRITAIARQAKEWDICTITGIPSWTQLTLERVIEYNKVQNIHEIWPNFQVYVSGGVAFGPYRKRFEQLTGKPIITLDTYYTSEGCLACQTRLDNDLMPMELVLHNGVFFEFVPFNDQNFQNGSISSDAKALSINDVEDGEEYAIVLSTCSGAWRYLLGDTVRMIDKERAEIKITGRTKHFLSVCGEHLSVDNMNAGIEAMEQKFDVIIPEFTVKAIKVDNHFEHHWYVAVGKKMEHIGVFAEALDACLRDLNDDYKTERSDNLLRSVKVHALPPKAFLQWLERQGKVGGQAKFPRVMTDTQFADWKEFIKNYEELD